MDKIVFTKEEFITKLKKIVEVEDSGQTIDEQGIGNEVMEWAIAFFDNHKGSIVKKFLVECCHVPKDEISDMRRKGHVKYFTDNVTIKQDMKAYSSQILQNQLGKISYDITTEAGQVLYDYCVNKNVIDRQPDIRTIDLFDLYKGIPISYLDNFKIKKKKGATLACTLALIVSMGRDKNNYVVAVGKLIPNEEGYCFVNSDIRNPILYDSFKNNSKYSLILFGSEAEDFLTGYLAGKKEVSDFSCRAYASTIKIRLCELRESGKPLCIDFGTSNTTAGTYGLRDKGNDHIECVEFEYFQDGEIKTSKLYPTMAYVKDCSKKKIEFLFGYEARKKVIECKYDTDATVYFELKRWITNLDEKEAIIEDENGNTMEDVSRREILKAYIENVIDIAQRYFKVKFKELHFSAPVKLKEVFVKEMQAILPKQYIVYGSSKCLDEGIAIVYDYIANEINVDIKDDTEKDNTSPSRMLILDCGGGTTDLVNCEYSYNTIIQNGDASLNINTQFENGNSNFGGNNITYRILQLLKLKMAAVLYEGVVECEIDELIPFTDVAILDEIDENVKNSVHPTTGSIYERFEKEYAKAEKYIPTKFAESDYYKSESKRNYYYLWQLAEGIKIEFYKQANLVTYNLADRITVEKIDDFFLYRYKKDYDDIEKDSEIPQIELTNNEIRKIIYADIYAVMNDLFFDISIESFDKYKLSGQSCNITLFQELLKEFITGRALRKTNLQATNNTEYLKLGCIKGSVAFIKDVKRGIIVPDGGSINYRPPKMIYQVEIVTGNPRILLSPDKHAGGVMFDSLADALKVRIMNIQGELVREPFEFKTNLQVSRKVVEMEEIKKLIVEHSEISEKDLDYICESLEATDFSASTVSTGMQIFATQSKDGYGFNIFQIYVKKNEEEGKYEYFLPEMKNEDAGYKPKYESFESASTSFFNGHK